MIDALPTGDEDPTPAPRPAPKPAPAPARQWVVALPHPTLGHLYTLAITLALAYLLLAPRLPALWPLGKHKATGVLHATLVYDAAGTTPHATGADVLEGNPGPELAKLDCLWKAYDKDAATLKDRNLSQFVDASGGPPVLIVQEEGVDAPLVHQPAPADAASVVKIVKGLRGTP